MRCIIRYKGPAPAQAKADLKELLSEVKVVDDSALPVSGLVEISDKDLTAIKEKYGHAWDFFPENNYKLPDTRKRIKK